MPPPKWFFLDKNFGGRKVKNNMSEDYLQASLNRLFENFELNDSNDKDVIRCLVELAFFENRIRGLKGNLPKALSRIRQVLLLAQDQELPKEYEKRTNDELSHLGRRMRDAREMVFSYLVPSKKMEDFFFSREKRKMSLPISAFGNETKKRIFHFFSGVIREELQEIQRTTNLAYPERAIKPLNDMLQELTRLFNVRESANDAEKLVFLRASLSEAKASYNNLKEQFQNALQSEDTARLENRLKKAQNQVSALASEIQKLEQKPMKRPIALTTPPI